MGPIRQELSGFVVHFINCVNYDFLGCVVFDEGVDFVLGEVDDIVNVDSFVDDGEHRTIGPCAGGVVGKKYFPGLDIVVSVDGKQNFVDLSAVEHLPVKTLSHVLDEPGVVYAGQWFHIRIWL